MLNFAQPESFTKRFGSSSRSEYTLMRESPTAFTISILTLTHCSINDTTVPFVTAAIVSEDRFSEADKTGLDMFV